MIQYIKKTMYVMLTCKHHRTWALFLKYPNQNDFTERVFQQEKNRSIFILMSPGLFTLSKFSQNYVPMAPEGNKIN